MVIEQKDIDTLLRWYIEYCLTQQTKYCGIISQINHQALLSRIFLESKPLVFNAEELFVVASWQQSGSQTISRFMFLPDNEKELIRKLHRKIAEHKKQPIVASQNKPPVQPEFLSAKKQEERRERTHLTWCKRILRAIITFKWRAVFVSFSV